MIAILAFAGAGGVWMAQSGEPSLPILRGDTWRYMKGTVEPPAAWNTAGFDDAGWSSGPSGIGYGDGDDATLLSDMQNGYTTVYTRRLFHVADPADIHGLELKVDYDDGFVAYLNGVEVARRNLPAGFPAFNSLASSSHEASGGTSGNAPETISLNAFLGQVVSGTNVLAVQAVNVSLASSDLSLIVELRATNSPPAAPASPSPASGSTGVSLNPVLCVEVGDPDSGTLTATFSGREVTGAPADDFTIIALPDTQYYSASYPATYAAQTQWIVDHRMARNIVYVTELGDCVDNATFNQQLVNADAAWDVIEANPYAGQPFGLPFGIAVGNHDQVPNGDPGTLADEGATTSAFNTWFGVPRFSGRAYYGGHYGANNDNHFDLFSASGMDFIALHLEYMPSDSPLRQAVIGWADGVLKAYPNRRAMLITHYLLDTGTSTAFGNQGQAIYDALKGNPNLFLMLAGHLDQASRRSDTYNGHTIHTLKSDYQTRPNGGDGWLRILTFSPANGTIHVETYSPTLGQFINNHPDNVAGTAQNDFVLPYEMAGGTPFAVINGDTASSGGTACVAWPGRQPGRQYEWYVTVSDGTDATTGDRYTFTTALNCTLDSDCADGNLCNGVETCVGNACQAGTPPACDDGNACTTETCDPLTGCSSIAIGCGDNDACTTDSCDALAGCQHQAVSCPQGQVCNGQTGLCQEPATACASAADCADADPCTTDTCVGANVSALSFDGTNDYVTFGAAPELGSAQFTLETWFKRTGPGVGNTTGGSGIASLVPLVSKGAPEADGSNVDANYILGINTAGNVLAADFEDTATGLNHPISGTTPIANDTWHHAAATYDGTTWRLYLDGNVEATLVVGAFTPRSDSIQHAGLGAMLTSTGTRLGAFQGLLDEVRIWNHARTQAEILDGKTRRIASRSGLIGRWGLDEAAGATAADSTTPGSQGTLTNFDLATAWAAGAPDLSAVVCSSATLPDGTSCTADVNACTADTCNNGTCMAAYSPTPGCCATDEQCDDGNPASIDACLGGTCENSAPASCATSAQCDDGNVCTADACAGGNVSALNFSGTSDYVSMGAAAGETALGARAFTLEAWVRRDGATWGVTTSTGTGGVTAVPLVTKGRGEAEGSNVDANYFLGITTGGRPVADFEQFAAGGGWSAGQNHPACSSASITDQNWHHVAVTYSATAGWKFYLDGIEGTTADGTSCTTCSPAGSCPQSPGVEPRYDSTQHFGLGTAMTSAGVAAGFYAGVMDEVRVWNRALSAAEIQAGRDQEVATAANLIGRWSLNENGGASAGDSTSPAQNGTLTNGPVWSPTDRAPIAPGTCQHTPGGAGAVCRASTGACDLSETCTGSSAFCPADQKQPDGTSCDDGGVCTTDDTCQSGVCLGGAPLPPPGEVSNVLFDPDGLGMAWDALPGALLPITYDVTRGSVSQPPVGGGEGAMCVDHGISAPRCADAATPPDGEAWWYLVRGRDACGTGTWGWAASDGVPTTERSVGACP